MAQADHLFGAGTISPAACRSEVAQWQADGLISEEQAGAILDRYGLSTEDGLPGELAATDSIGSADSTGDLVEQGSIVSRAVSIIGVMGALLVGLGIIIYVAANWDVIPVWARVAMLVGLTAAINVPRAGCCWPGLSTRASAWPCSWLEGIGLRGGDPSDRPDLPRSRKSSQSDHRVVPGRTADGVYRAFPPGGGIVSGAPGPEHGISDPMVAGILRRGYAPVFGAADPGAFSGGGCPGTAPIAVHLDAAPGTVLLLSGPGSWPSGLCRDDGRQHLGRCWKSDLGGVVRRVLGHGRRGYRDGCGCCTGILWWNSRAQPDTRPVADIALAATMVVTAVCIWGWFAYPAAASVVAVQPRCVRRRQRWWLSSNVRQFCSGVVPYCL